ncbi:MAG: M23 family metallopeptidase [Bacteroidales bacterium]|nr:M23 family metallopeptidase [Bacteroidales bacterium]HPD95200.1 M23 family metallopeptidase [Tenuifilaceae bacterium]HRX31476.1 M23 family metallopeptidase [Tenuifilaceae bacterium]
MARLKYRFNPHTLTFDVVTIPWYKRLAKIVIHLGFYAGVFIGLGYLFSLFYDTPIAQGLKRSNADYKLKYEMAYRQIGDLSDQLGDMEKRDNNIYRSIFESDPIPYSIRQGGRGGAERYADLRGLENGNVIVNTLTKLDELTWRAYIQSRSFDEVVELAKNKERLIECIPAIQPISVKNLVRISDFYGMRIDPVFHRPSMHCGIDFAGPEGTPIYATGDGVVVEADYSFHGYGNEIIVDHGFGYKTRYAHLKKIEVKVGQKVKRAELIGLLGNTGKSTGPHLHYEVIHKNIPVNPINYFNNMTEEDYEAMLKNASSEFLD